jgi:hypothetical protein
MRNSHHDGDPAKLASTRPKCGDRTAQAHFSREMVVYKAAIVEEDECVGECRIGCAADDLRSRFTPLFARS